jgi:hypothetical protein
MSRAVELEPPMPRYFFHVHDSKDMPDREGTEFPSDEAAKSQAIVLTGELLTDLDGDFWGHPWILEVVDDSDSLVCEVAITAKSRS